VIELKKGRESDKVVGQALRYIGWVSEELCKDGQKVRGIIICREPDDRLYYVVKVVPNLELKYYHIDFRLSDSV
jgi:restriction system protein